MSHIVESCPLTKLNSGLSRLHSADKNEQSSPRVWIPFRWYKKCRMVELSEVISELVAILFK